MRIIWVPFALVMMLFLGACLPDGTATRSHIKDGVVVRKDVGLGALGPLLFTEKQIEFLISEAGGLGGKNTLQTDQTPELFRCCSAQDLMPLQRGVGFAWVGEKAKSLIPSDDKRIKQGREAFANMSEEDKESELQEVAYEKAIEVVPVRQTKGLKEGGSCDEPIYFALGIIDRHHHMAATMRLREAYGLGENAAKRPSLTISFHPDSRSKPINKTNSDDKSYLRLATKRGSYKALFRRNMILPPATIRELEIGRVYRGEAGGEALEKKVIQKAMKASGSHPSWEWESLATDVAKNANDLAEHDVPLRSLISLLKLYLDKTKYFKTEGVDREHLRLDGKSIQRFAQFLFADVFWMLLNPSKGTAVGAPSDGFGDFRQRLVSSCEGTSFSSDMRVAELTAAGFESSLTAMLGQPGHECLLRAVADFLHDSANYIRFRENYHALMLATAQEK